MICEDAESFIAALPGFGALAGLDLGTVTIGVAVSDGMRSVASPIVCPQSGKADRPADCLLGRTPVDRGRGTGVA